MFADRLSRRASQIAPICIGLDPHLDRLPSALRGLPALQAVRAFCLGAVEALAPVTAAVKPQVAFFEQLGADGVAILQETVAEARRLGLLVILDAKRGDIGSTAEAYARATLDADGPMHADAVTLSPYLGPESLAPFLQRCDAGHGLFVLVRTSNPGAGPWQASIAPQVAAWIAAQNLSRRGAHDLGPIGAVVGATLFDEAPLWRAAMPHAWFLVPGVGAQGATPAQVRAHFRPDGSGALVVSARAVLFPPAGDDDGAQWAEAIAQRAKRLGTQLNPPL